MGPGASARDHFGFASADWNTRIYLFGGRTDTGMSDELWFFDDAGWSQVTRSGAWPSARRGLGATYDAERQAFIIYGGEDGNALDDAWSWNGNAWTELCSACTGTPRYTVELVYYPPALAPLLIGGFTGSLELGATWDFSVIPPVQISTDPPTRDSVSAVYDPMRHVLTAIGGNGPGCSVECDDIWSYGGP